MIEPFIEIPNLEMPKGKWRKTVKTRMRVFNGQIFEGIYYYHSKFNRNMNIAYMIKTFEKLLNLAVDDPTITRIEVSKFSSKYAKNLLKLLNKELEEKVPIQID